MRGGALPPALLAAALGLALAFAPRRTLMFTLPMFAVAAGLASLWRPPAAWTDAIFLGCWLSVAACSASVHLPNPLGFRGALALAALAGFWAGAVIAAAGAANDLFKALPWVLICVPALWVVAQRRQVVVKVGAGWLVAVAILAATIPATTQTPGYEADHME